MCRIGFTMIRRTFGGVEARIVMMIFIGEMAERMDVAITITEQPSVIGTKDTTTSTQ